MKKEELVSKRAVALNYEGSGAPVIIAKGQGEVASQIETIAGDSNIPIVNDPALTETLASVPLGSEIPETLYLTVAELLIFVYSLTDRQ